MVAHNNMSERSYLTGRRYLALQLASLVFVAVWLSSCGASKSPSSGNDPLSVADVQEELDKLPLSLEVLLPRLNKKQDYFDDYLLHETPEELIERDQDLRDVVQMKLRGDMRRTDDTFVWAEGYSGDSAESVVAFVSCLSWDGWAGGGQKPVHATANWRLYVNKDGEVIAYYRRLYDDG